MLTTARAAYAEECPPVSTDREWSTLVEALAHAVGAFRAQLDKLAPNDTALNAAQPDAANNELDKSDVQCALLRLRMGRLTRHNGEERRLLKVDTFLANAHAKFHELWEEARDTEKARIEEVGRNLHALLRKRNPNGPLNAVLRVGVVVADVSNDGHGRLERAGGAVRARPAWIISWGTRPPWRWYRPRIGGGFGYEAVPAVWSFSGTLTSSEATGEPCDTNSMESCESAMDSYLVQHQDGLFYDAFFNWPNISVGTGQLAGFVGGGQARLTSQNLTDGSGATARLGSLAKNRTGVWSYRYEDGVEYRLFDRDRIAVEYGRDSVSPVFEISLGLRTHERFKASDELAFLSMDDSLCLCDMNAVRYGVSPQRRMYWRLGVDLQRVLSWSEDKTNPFSVRFIAEQEWDWPGDSLPTMTRIFVQGETALKKLGLGGDD